MSEVQVTRYTTCATCGVDIERHCGPCLAKARAQDRATQCALDERARIVEWLRAASERKLHQYITGDDAAGDIYTAVSATADGIERGEHLK